MSIEVAFGREATITGRGQDIEEFATSRDILSNAL